MVVMKERRWRLNWNEEVRRSTLIRAIGSYAYYWYSLIKYLRNYEFSNIMERYHFRVTMNVA